MPGFNRVNNFVSLIDTVSTASLNVVERFEVLIETNKLGCYNNNDKTQFNWPKCKS